MDRSPTGSGQSAMPFHSILFDQPGGARALAHDEPACFADLHLDQVVDALTAGREAYNLKPFLYAPLHDVAAVQYRHDILRDLEREPVFTCITAFAEQMRRMRQHLAQSIRLHYKYQKERWFLDAVKICREAVRSLTEEAAESFRAYVRTGVLTHFKREEDASMTSGKLDKELSRVSEIADTIAPDGLLLCNESFASTKEREGSEIARQIIRALIEGGAKVFFVTHLLDLTHGFHLQQLPTALFLRAVRLPDGSRTFRLAEGEPLPTSFGEDSYARIFGSASARFSAEEQHV